MRHIVTLLKPRIFSFKNRTLSKNDKGRRFKTFLFVVIGTFFWTGVFVVSLKVLTYFRTIAELGDILAFKLLSMILLTFFSLLVFSGILTSLSKLYLSRDLSLVHSMPVPSYKIFISRWIESTIDSSWMVILYALPVFISYGLIYRSAPFYFVNFVISVSALTIISSSISVMLVIIVVHFVPANRLKNIFIFFGICLFLILFFAFRLLRPERLVDPEIFSTALVYLKSLKTPAPIYLPSTWAFDSIKASLLGHIQQGLFHGALSWSAAGVMVFMAVIVADALYFKGLSKTRTARIRLFKFNFSDTRLPNVLPRSAGALISKEIKTFCRDQTQWSQLFLVAALVVIYIYNFNALPLEKSPIRTVYLQNLLSFLNMGLAGFVLTAVTARFAYPAISNEGEAFWIVKSTPISLRGYLWIKFLIYFFPLLILTEILVVASNLLLHVTPFMMTLSMVNIFFLVPGTVSMGIGFGAAYPDFKSENPAQTVTSFGGFLFMMVCAGYIGSVLIIEAGPVYTLFISGIKEEGLNGLEWTWVIVSFSLAFILSIAAIVVPMNFGEKRLSKLLI